jgi:hypothetical protein
MHGVADPIPEDETETRREEEPAKLRKCSGKRSEEWKISPGTEARRRRF